MSPTAQQARAWVRQWETAGPALARLRAAEIRRTPMAVVALQLETAWLAARLVPRAPSSGLVEQQRLFALARR